MFLGLIVMSLSADAQILDTSEEHRYKPIEVYSFEADEIAFFQVDSAFIDTQLNQFIDYYPAYQQHFPFIDLGMEASAILPLSLSQERQLNLTLGMSATNPLFFDDRVHIYQTPRPFTRLQYSQGPNEMIHVEVTHAQQISERLSFGLDYRRIKNQNIYFSNIQSLNTARINSLFNSKFYTSYYSPDRKYEIVVSYLWNKSDNVETDGIVSESAFNALEPNLKPSNNDVILTDASSLHAQNSFKITQYYRPGGKSTDSTLDRSLSQFSSQFYLTTQLDNNRYEFLDEDPEPAIYIDTLNEVKDSFYHRTFSNTIGYVYNYKTVALNLGLRHAYDGIYLNGVDTSFQNIQARGEARFGYKSFGLKALARLGLLGYNLGDYHFTGIAETEYKGLRISASLTSQLVEPTFQEKRFSGTLINWNRNLRKIAFNSLRGELGYTRNNHYLLGKVSAETSTRPVYFDNNAIPQQYDGSVSLFSTEVKYKYIKPKFGGGISGIFQNSSNQIVLPRPSLSLSGNAYTSFYLFKKNLNVQLGAKTFWFSEFRSPRYNPYTRSWYNADDFFKSYPPINPYLNGKVKSFCFGIEFFHVQEGLMRNDYYSSPSYPMLPRSFRLHFQWDLSN